MSIRVGRNQRFDAAGNGLTAAGLGLLPPSRNISASVEIDAVMRPPRNIGPLRLAAGASVLDWARGRTSPKSRRAQQ